LQPASDWQQHNNCCGASNQPVTGGDFANDPPDLDILDRSCRRTRMSMYRELFDLDEPPFRLTPDPQFLFASKQHTRAKAYMESTIWLADGFVVVTGEIGSGKTTLIEAFLSDLPDNVTLAYLTQTQIKPVEFLQSVLVEFGYKPFKARKVELMSMLKDFFVEQYAAGRQVLLVIDEAQNLSRKVLEEVRLLSGIEAQKEKVLRIILVGQPELNDKLDSRRLAQLTQRVRLRFHLGPLNESETRDYIEHRLRVAGSDGRQIFSEDSFATIFRYCGGVPRLVNILCDTAMLCAFAAERKLIDHAVVMEAVAELQWAEYAQRMHGLRAPVQEPAQTRGKSVIAHDRSHPAMARLEVMFGDQRVGVHELPRGRTIIGRTTDNNLQIRSKFVSRHHAQIISDAQQSMLEDLNSTNGIMVGATPVKRHRLIDGDVILLGEHRLVYRDLRAALAQFEPDPGNDPGRPHDGDLDDEHGHEELAPKPGSA
jgi:general secretion pathway protein A